MVFSRMDNESEPAPKPNLAFARTTWQHIAIYYAIACGLSWAIWAPVILGDGGLKLLNIAPPKPSSLQPALGPLLACYMTDRICAGNWRAVRLLSWRWLDWVWLLVRTLLVFPCLFVVLPY